MEPRSANASEWNALVDGFVDSYLTFHPSFAVAAGRHEFDGQLPDWSREGLQRQVKWLQDARRRALELASGAADEAIRFERDYLLSVIDGNLFWLQDAEAPYRNPLFYSGALDPNAYVTRPYAPLEHRVGALIAYAGQMPRAAAQIRENLRTPLPPTFARFARASFGGLAAFIERDIPAALGPGLNIRQQRDWEQVSGTACRALRELEQWMQLETSTSESASYALGADLYQRMLRCTEALDISLSDLQAAGRRELERNQAALEEACRRYGPDLSIQECVDRVQSLKPEEGPIAAARRQLPELKAFLLEHDLVGIPGSEEALVAEAPAHMRWNSAYIEIPGPYETGLPSVFYVAPPEPTWSEADRLAYLPGRADLLFTSVHEVWPGHFLQYLHSNRAASSLRRVFVGYGFAEGWAHYSEEMMWEAGLGDGSPEIHIGQLLNALLRNVRYLCAIGLHTQGMTEAEAERHFRELAYQDRASARQQAARGTFDPGYLNYTLGKLMIRKLRQDWTAGQGRTAWRRFHDQLLSFGGPPIPLLRRAMLNGSPAAAL